MLYGSAMTQATDRAPRPNVLRTVPDRRARARAGPRAWGPQNQPWIPSDAGEANATNANTNPTQPLPHRSPPYTLREPRGAAPATPGWGPDTVQTRRAAAGNRRDECGRRALRHLRAQRAKLVTRPLPGGFREGKRARRGEGPEERERGRGGEGGREDGAPRLPRRRASLARRPGLAARRWPQRHTTLRIAPRVQCRPRVRAHACINKQRICGAGCTAARHRAGAVCSNVVLPVCSSGRSVRAVARVLHATKHACTHGRRRTNVARRGGRVANGGRRGQARTHDLGSRLRTREFAGRPCAVLCVCEGRDASPESERKLASPAREPSRAEKTASAAGARWGPGRPHSFRAGCRGRRQEYIMLAMRPHCARCCCARRAPSSRRALGPRQRA